MGVLAQPMLAGFGVDEKVMAAVAALSGALQDPRGLRRRQMASPTIALVGAVEQLDDPSSWLPPIFALIEIADADADQLAGIVRRASGYDFFYSFGAASSSSLPLAGCIARFIGERVGSFGEERLQDIELALHEAVSNALVHGNLGVGSISGLSIDALDDYSHAMQSSLADPLRARRRVEVRGKISADAVSIDVLDEGPGYAAGVAKDPSACGRGLELIAALTRDLQILDGGRRLSMRFDA